METALSHGAMPPGEAGSPLAGYAAPRVDLPPELRAWFREGEPEADACERILASAARVRGSIEAGPGPRPSAYSWACTFWLLGSF